MGHDPITHARRARCVAHVGFIFNDCVIVIVSTSDVTHSDHGAGFCLPVMPHRQADVQNETLRRTLQKRRHVDC